MRIEHLLLSLIALLLSFCLIACGLYLWIFPETLLDFRTIGIAFVTTGTLLLFIFVFMMRRRYLLLKMGGVSVHEKLVRLFATKALQDLFPNQAVDCEVIFHKKGKIELLANIPYLSDEKREKKIEEIEARLSVDLLKYCGFKDSFIFNVSFF